MIVSAHKTNLVKVKHILKICIYKLAFVSINCPLVHTFGNQCTVFLSVFLVTLYIKPHYFLLISTILKA